MNYQLNSYVNRKEAEALKELIFRRVKERTDALTGDVQADVMDIARESVSRSKNPFAQVFIQTAKENTEKPEESIEQPSETVSPLHEFVEIKEAQAEEVGFPKKEIPVIVNQYREYQEEASARQIQTTMREAREGLSNKKSFMGALEFLNSQAAVSLLNKRSKGLEIVA